MKPSQQTTLVGGKTTFGDVWKWGQELERIHTRIAPRFARSCDDLQAQSASYEPTQQSHL